MSMATIQTRDRHAYLTERQTRIGGADAAAILGINPYQTRYDCWHRKVCDVSELEDISLGNGHIARGVVLEQVVFDMIKHGVKNLYGPIDPTVEEGVLMAHPEYEYITGTPDAVGADRIWEIKCPTTYSFERMKKEGLHDYWVVQAQHYALVTGKPVTFAVLDYDAWEPFIVDITPDPELHKLMIDEYALFMEHVYTKTPPDDYGPYHVRETVLREDDYDLDALAAAYVVATSVKNDSYKAYNNLKGRLLSAVQGHDEVVTSGHIIRVDSRRHSSGSTYQLVKVSEIAGK